MEGCYHGHHDSVQVSVAPDPEEVGPADRPLRVPASSGIPGAIMSLTLVVGYNDLGAVAGLLEEYPGEVAGMILEPIMMNAGIILPEQGYLQGLNDLLHAHGALLTFDEVKTGLTSGYGGASSLTGVTPDLVCLAKAIGGGIASAAVGGTAEVMGHVANGDYEMVGTFNGNPLAMAATRAMLTKVATPESYERIAELSAKVSSELTGIMDARDLPAHVVSVGAKGCATFATERVPRLPRLPTGRRPLQPRTLALPAQRRRVPAAVGQDRAVAHLGAARRGRHRQVPRELRALRGGSGLLTPRGRRRSCATSCGTAFRGGVDGG